MLPCIIQAGVHIRVIVDCRLVYLSYPYQLQTRIECHSYTRQSSTFVVAEVGHMFPVNVIFPASCGIFRVPNSYDFFCVDKGPVEP